MKRFPALCVLGALVAMLISTGKYLNAQEDIPCETAPVQSGTNGAAWAKGTASNPTIVTVFLNPNDFPTDSERSAMHLPLRLGKTLTLMHILLLM